MTTEPRQEAERIVNWLLHELVETNDAVTGSDYGRWKRHHDSLVTALAAAIEVERQDREERQGAPYASASMVRLSEALSALREDETWHAS